MSHRAALGLAAVFLFLWARKARASAPGGEVSFDLFQIGRPGELKKVCAFDNETNTVIGCT